MKAEIVNIEDLSSDWDKHGGRPKAKLDMPLLRAMRDQGMSISDISSRTGIPRSTIGDALRGKLTPKLEKRRRRRQRKGRRTRIKI